MWDKILNRTCLRRLIPCSIVVFASLFAGCQPPKIETGYGRSSGPGYSSSLNGTSVLHRMYESRGFPVERYSKMSPRWDTYQTVVWMPDSFVPPSEKHIQWVESWLSRGYQRTLVYVARDYDAAVSYWDQLCEQTEDSSPQQAELRRKFHEQITHDFQSGFNNSDLSCLWFRYQQHADTQAKKITGSLVDRVDTEALDLQYGDLPKPGSLAAQSRFGIYDVEFLLSVDDHPMVYRLNHHRLGQGQIIIVGNGSFLLNLPLANPANRELAGNLIELTTENNSALGQPVLFIENTRPLPILERDILETHSSWSWITKQPLRYIVPNILFCSMLFCFVYFPIFGRARKLKSLQSSNFMDHVDALGQMLKRTGSDTEANSWIEQYKQNKKMGKPSRD